MFVWFISTLYTTYRAIGIAAPRASGNGPTADTENITERRKVEYKHLESNAKNAFDKNTQEEAKQDRGQGLSPEEFLLIKKAVHSRFRFDEYKGRHTLVLALKLNNEEWAKWCFQLEYGIGKYGKSNRLVTSGIINERNLPKEIK